MGLRLVIALPTFFFMFSQAVRVGLRLRAKKELMNRRELSAFFSIFADAATRESRWEFFIDATILAIINGLILAFELSRLEFGVILVVIGIILSLAGLVATEANSGTWVFFTMFLFITVFISELCYFAVFGLSLEIWGITLMPRHVFFAPYVIVLIVVFFAILKSRSKKTSRKQ
jgi:hypothetical protein